MPLESLARFTVERLTVLDENGNLDTDLEPSLTPEQHLRLYRAMVLARQADERQLKLQRQGRMGTFPLCTGQEAVACGAALALRDEDWLVPAFRETGAMLLRGTALEDLFLYYNGFEEGNRQPDGSRNLPVAVIVASQTLHATGLAHAMRYRGEDAAVLVFLGDGATSQGDFYEAMNFAGVWKAPVVFVVQNNQWAISIPRARQSAAGTLAQKAIAAGIQGLQVDGNDPLAVFRAVDEALQRARAGDGPSVVEAETYRLLMHTTADDPRRYREEAEEQAWWERDPLRRYRDHLRQKGLLSEEREQALAQEVRQEVDDAVKVFERRSASADDGDLPADLNFRHVFGTSHAIIREQREAFRARREGGYDD